MTARPDVSENPTDRGYNNLTCLYFFLCYSVTGRTVHQLSRWLKVLLWTGQHCGHEGTCRTDGVFRRGRDMTAYDRFEEVDNSPLELHNKFNNSKQK